MLLFSFGFLNYIIFSDSFVHISDQDSILLRLPFFGAEERIAFKIKSIFLFKAGFLIVLFFTDQNSSCGTYIEIQVWNYLCLCFMLLQKKVFSHFFKSNFLNLFKNDNTSIINVILTLFKTFKG